jgi:hypothetical protein
MPILGNNFAFTYEDVASRTRSILNDDGGQIWTDSFLLNHINNAYRWVYNNIARYVDVSFVKVTNPDLIYVTTGLPGQEQDIGGILPQDLYLPIDLQFRANISEEWQPVNRLDRLPERATQIPERIYEWEWRGRSIWVIAANQNGLLRLRYLSLLPLLLLSGDQVLITNAVEAMAHRTAYEAYKRRGQVPLAQSEKADAQEFMDQMLDHLILNDQYVGRRGQRFGNNNGSDDDTNNSTFFG